MAQQYDFFGGLSEIKEVKKPSHKYKTMQELHGVIENEICKNCSHLRKYDYHNRTYYKCALWIISHSSVTDIRIRSKACGKWEISR